MCRVAAYLGKFETPLSSLVLDPAHSLLVQSYAPEEMMSGVVNADGFGVGWYAPEVSGEPAVYRSERPLWADTSFASIAPKVLSRTIFAAVRSATPGLPAEHSGVPPFSSGPFAFMHNGAIENFRRTAMRPLRDSLDDESYAEILGATDSETIFACLLDRLKKDPADLPGAVVETVRHVSRICAKSESRATLNLAVTDGRRMVFSRHSTEGPGNSLYFLEDGESFPEATTVASERLNGEAGWQKVPDRHLLLLDERGEASLRRLDA